MVEEHTRVLNNILKGTNVCVVITNNRGTWEGYAKTVPYKTGVETGVRIRTVAWHPIV